MHFAELPARALTPEGRIPLELLSELRGIIPDEVLEQFIGDHAAKAEFQEQYGHLNLTQIVWDLPSLPASEISQASVYSRFRNWTNSVAARIQRFDQESWACIDVRLEVVSHWALNHTWMRAPILLDGQLLGRQGGLHLVEGHTRIGILKGLVHRKIIAPDSRHAVWVGRSRG